MFSITTNLGALTASRFLARTQTAQASAIEQLATGLRINGAADDAAGLAVSQGLTAQINGTSQAIRNAQDGVNLVQTADGALAESQAALQRMRVLAVQASNGTYDDADRADMQDEVDQLEDELDDVADTTSYGSVPLLDGSFVDQEFQVGPDSGDTIAVTLPGALVQPEVPAVAAHPDGRSYLALAGPEDADWNGAGRPGYAATGLGTVTFSNDGNTSAVDLSGADGSPASVVALLNIQFANDGSKFSASWDAYTGSVTVATTYDSADPVTATGGNVTTDETSYSTALGEPSEIGWSTGDEPIGTTYDEGSLSWTGTTTGGATLPDLTEVTSLSLTVDGRAADGSTTPVTLTVPLTGVATSADDYGPVDAAIQSALQANPLTQDLYQVDSYGYSAPWVDTGDAPSDIDPYTDEHWNSAGGRSGIQIRNLWPDHYPDEADPMSMTATMADGTTTTVTGSYGAQPAGYGTQTGIMIGATPEIPAKYAAFDSVGLGTRAGVDLRTQASAQASIAAIDTALQSLSNTRAYLGAKQNAFEASIGVLTNDETNLSGADSTIVDADMGAESMALSESQILAQAGTAMLKQANSSSQLVLSLLS